MYCITSVFIYIVYKHRILLLEVDSISKQMSRWFYLKEKILLKQYCNTNNSIKLKNTVLIQEN